MKKIYLFFLILLFCRYPLKEKEGPKILKPSFNETFSPFSQIIFEWEKIDEAINYHFMLDDTNTFKTPIIDKIISENFLILEGLKEGVYYFKVRYLDKDSFYSDWSEIRSFKIKFLNFLKSFKTEGYPNDISFYKNFLFVAGGQVGLEIFDEKGKINFFSDGRNILYALAIDTLRNLLYLAYGEKEISILNLNLLPDTIYEITSLSWPIAYGYDLSILNDTIVIIAADKQFLVTNVKDTLFLYLISQLYFPSSLRGCYTLNNLIFLACEQEGIYIYQLTDSITFLSKIDTPNNARDLVGNDSLLFVADGRGISIIDIKNPNNPIFKKEIPINGYCKKLFLKDSLLFAACGSGGLKVYKIVKEPEYLKILSEIKFNDCRTIFVDKNYQVYVGTRDEGILIYQISF
ncbi:MAG: hypothetical protein NZ608_01840 [candidate division WOR-3 bacterium]|nr:hypothetical protein [candidate division WOR-3 bacterium]